jgi:endopolyphosphatase
LNLESSQSTANHEEDLCDALIDNFGRLPKAKNTNVDHFAVINVSPSVVPNPYLPTFRIYTYNVSDLQFGDWKKKRGSKRKPTHPHDGSGDKQKLCKERQYRDSWKCKLNETWFSDPDSPSRTNRLWSPLGYAQVCSLSHSPTMLTSRVVLYSGIRGGQQNPQTRLQTGVHDVSAFCVISR